MPTATATTTPAGRAGSRRDCPPRRSLTREQFLAELRAQGMPSGHDAAFKCPSCGHVQSVNSLQTFAGLSRQRAEKAAHCECEGRHNPARGCDWALYGLLHIHTVEVMTDEGPVPAFEPASAAEAAALRAEVEAAQQAQGR